MWRSSSGRHACRVCLPALLRSVPAHNEIVAQSSHAMPCAKITDCRWCNIWLRNHALRLTQCTPPAKQSLTAVTACGVDAKGASECYAAGMDGGEAAVLDARVGQHVRHWTAHSGSISDVACKGEQLVTASDVRSQAASSNTAWWTLCFQANCATSLKPCLRRIVC